MNLWIKSQIKQVSLGGFEVFKLKLKKFFISFLYFLFIILYFPFFLIIRIISGFFFLRFCRIPSRRVGHLILDADQYLNNSKKNPGLDIFFLEKPVSNMELINLFKRHIFILPELFILPFIILNKIKFLGNASHIFTMSNHEGWTCRSRKNENFQYFNSRDNERGEFFLKNLGITKNDKFVCILCRDSTYVENLFKKKTYDFDYLERGDSSTFRNCNIENFRSVCEYLLSKGYYVFRLGEKVSGPFIIKNKNFFDYSTNGMRNEFLDIYLGGKCEFFLSTGSGIDSIAEVFHRPRVYVSNARLAYIPIYYHKQLTISKHFVKINDNSKLTLSEIFDLNLPMATKNSQFKEKKIKLIENNSDEIKDATIEMIDLINNNFILSEEKTFYEKKFWTLFKKKSLEKNINHLDPNLYLSNFGLNYLKQNPNFMI
jgi:putative glycosyltransferase (TIGR04372 family)